MSLLQKITAWTAGYKETITAVFGLLAVLFSLTANAQGINTGITPLQNASAVTTLLCNVLSVMFWVLISVSIIMILWAAWLYVTALDDESKISEAKMTILYAAIGIVVAMGAKGFPFLVASIFPGASVSGCS